MLKVRRCGIGVARVGVARTHRHLPKPPPSAMVAYELVVRGWPVGWMLVGRPVSCAMQAAGWLEVTRVAVPAVADGGPLHGCSALYGAAARWARQVIHDQRRERARLVRDGLAHPEILEAPAIRGVLTYTRVDEPGTSLRAAGWVPIARTETRAGGRPWSRKGRERASSEAESVGKVRWCPRWCFIGPELPPEWVSICAREAA